MTWATRVLWLTLPLTLGDLISASLDGRSDSIRVTVVVLSWAAWAAGLLASLVIRPIGLTTFRLLVPLPLVAAIVAAIAGEPSGLGWLGLATAALVLVLALSAEVGADFIDGASYGDERRFALRPPGALLLGPLPIVWVLAVVMPVAGLLLLAAKLWFVGTVVTALGLAAAWWGTRVLHRLAVRCLVFVPAGMTLVDGLTLAEPVLFKRRDVRRLGPAPVDTVALDLSAASPGLILQIDVDPAVSVVPRRGLDRVTEATPVGSVLIAPSRPGAVLDHAGTRQLAVQRG